MTPATFRSAARRPSRSASASTSGGGGGGPQLIFNDRRDATLIGRLEAETDVGLHAFTAPLTGSVFISPDIGTHAVVSLLDADGQPLLTVGSFFLAYPIEAGARYFIRVSMATGDYAVSISVRP